MAHSPSVSQLSTALLGRDSRARAITAVLDAVARELEPLAATFFRVGAAGEIACSVVRGSHLPAPRLVDAVRSWKLELRDIDPLAPSLLAALPDRVLTVQDLAGRAPMPASDRLREAYKRIGVINDARMAIRADGRVVAGVTLWRPHRSRAWSESQLRRLEALQPLAESAYVFSREATGEEGWLPATLTARQREVARLLAAGASNMDVARALQISPETARSHTRAVLERLRVRSRREVTMRAERATAPPWRGSVDDAARRVLGLTLDWSAQRLGPAVVGCALVSPRLDVVANAWGTAGSPADPGARELVGRLHDQLLSWLRSAGAVERLSSEHGAPPVARLDLDAGGPGGASAHDLLRKLGLAVPTLVTLRAQGRLASLVWLAVRQDADRGEAVRALRRVHPLLEQASQPLLQATSAADPHGGELAFFGLTPRELEVARLAITGASNEAIAARLRISLPTVKSHMTRVLTKCGVRSRTQLIALARDLTQRTGPP